MTYDTRLWEMQQVTAQAEQYRMNQSTSKKNINDYSEALFQSIDTIVSERIKRLPYDYTIVATITNADNAYIGAYNITDDHLNDLMYSREDALQFVEDNNTLKLDEE